jgi:RNA polymerase-binding transcription factor DksA
MVRQAEAHEYQNRLRNLLRRLDRERTDLKDDALRPAGGEASGGLSNVPLHPADLGSHDSEEQVALGLLEQKEAIIAEINAALDRLEHGTFGRCESCQKPIPPERLEAVPYARYCVDCARRIENKPAP